MLPTASQFALLVLTFGFGLALWTHEIYAARREWALRPWYRAGLFRGVGFVGAAAVFSLALTFFPLWFAASVAISGLSAGLLMTFAIKARVQMVAPAGLAVCWLADFLFVIP